MAKCDTNPLTKAKHRYYIHHPDWPRQDSTSKEEPHPKGRNSHRRPHGLNVQAHPKVRTSAPRLKRKPPSPHTKGPGSPFPQPSGDGRSINSKQHVGVRDQPTRRTIHPERSSQRYAHSPAKYNSPPMQGLLRAIEPLWDSTVVTIGQFRSALDDGSGFVLPFLRMVEPSVLRTRTPHLSRPPQ